MKGTETSLNKEILMLSKNCEYCVSSQQNTKDTQLSVTTGWLREFQPNDNLK